MIAFWKANILIAKYLKKAFIHSKIHKVIDGFKEKDGDKRMINYEKSLHDFNFHNIDTVHTTYNQLLNMVKISN